jgi:hypothetical protein
MTKLVRSLLIFAVVLITASLLIACIGSGGYSIRVVNGTSHPVCGLYTRESHSYSRRSKNHLGRNRLLPEKEFSISVKEGNYDVEAEICDNETSGYGKTDITVKEGLHPIWIIGQ